MERNGSLYFWSPPYLTMCVRDTAKKPRLNPLADLASYFSSIKRRSLDRPERGMKGGPISQNFRARGHNDHIHTTVTGSGMTSATAAFRLRDLHI